MLRLENVHTFYGPIEAVKGIDIEVGEGEIVCLIGSNGAGKSTTLMTISGILRPRTGHIHFEGQDIGSLSAHKIVGLGISQVPEGRRIFPRLTVLENLEMGAYSAVGSGKVDSGQLKIQLGRVFDLFPVLGERRKQLGGTLSGGEQQMLAIGRALMSRP
ncbi:MAG TPA: ATP-binding cassette domain-containing protein, partial [Thermodesulfovibrionales bacterium]|nr:ATP-binding cassette domain-containing protein [Thermodesulfovibrionales bacterium]